MKKIFIILIFMIFFLLDIVSAKEICNDNLSKNKEYLWYRLEENSRYFPLYENTKEYPLLDKTNFKKTEYTNWINVLPPKKEDREIQTRKIYEYKESYPIHYFFLHSFTFEGDIIELNAIKIFDKEKDISYKISCQNCSKNIEEKNDEEGIFYINKNSIIKISLSSFEPSDDFRVDFSFKKLEDKKISMKINATEKDDINDIFYQYIYNFNSLNEDKNNEYSFHIYLKDFKEINPRYKEEKESTKKIKKQYNRVIKEKEEYRFRDTLYRYYNIKKIYGNVNKKTNEFPNKEVIFFSNSSTCDTSLSFIQNRKEKNILSYYKKIMANKKYNSKNNIKTENRKKMKRDTSSLFCIFLIIILILKRKCEKK